MTIHLVTVADVHDHKIGEGCAVDQESMHKLFRQVDAMTGVGLREHRLRDDSFNAEAVTNAVSGLTPSSSDAVAFYYSGHGHRSESKADKWPFLTLGRTPVGKAASFDVQWIYKTLREKGPRMLMVVVDCCNWPIEEYKIAEVSPKGEAVPRGRREADNYSYLFCSWSGEVLAMAAQPGEYAMGSPFGGYFTNVLLRTIRGSVRKPSARWRPILEKAAVPHREPQNPTGYQTPVYCVRSRHRRGADPALELGAMPVLYADLAVGSQRDLVKETLYDLAVAGMECALQDVGGTQKSAEQQEAQEDCWARCVSSRSELLDGELEGLLPVLDLAGQLISGQDLADPGAAWRRGLAPGGGATRDALSGSADALPAFDGQWRMSARAQTLLVSQGAAARSAATGELQAGACPECAGARERGQRFCPGCGSELVAAPPKKAFCPSCGSEVQAGQAFCAGCGTNIGVGAAGGPGASPEQGAKQAGVGDLGERLESRLEQRLGKLDPSSSSSLAGVRDRLKRR